MVKICQRCLYTSDHPLGITFDDNGICSGCRIHGEKDTLDWRSRWQELEELVRPYRAKSAQYDCIVPTSGANDSFFVLDIVVNKLKLKPLVVSYNKLFNTKVGIENLSRQRIAFNIDFQQKVVDPRLVRKITRSSLFQFGNPYWHCLAGKTVFPVQTSVMLRIPLIIWGAHQGVEQVGMFSHLHNVEMTRRYRKDHDLFGVEAEDFTKTYDELNEEDLVNFRYPAFSDIRGIGVRGIYLSNYIRWDPYAQHLKMVKKFGYKGLTQSRTFDGYDHADCYVYSNIHDVLKYFKHGYSKVTDQACREIRFGRLTRKKAAELVSYYEAKEPDHMKKFCDWLQINEASLKMVIEQFRKGSSSYENHERRSSRLATDFNLTKPQSGSSNLDYPSTEPVQYENTPHSYITIGKGIDWPRENLKKKHIKWI